MSKVIRVTQETVSDKILQEMLPRSCYEAIKKGTEEASLDDDIYLRYFESSDIVPLNENEQIELFDQLGNVWVKNHYSTPQLRSFLEREPTTKKARNRNE